LSWLRDRCSVSKNVNGNGKSGKSQKDQITNPTPTENDAIIVAGDISHELSVLEETLSIIVDSLSCHVFFVFGNHEAWIGGEEMDSLGIENSLEKIEMVNDVCRKLGVYTDFKLIGRCQENPAIIVPLDSWYDGSLAFENCEDLCTSFHVWPWVDFSRCNWPDERSLKKELIDDIDGDGDDNDYHNMSREMISSDDDSKSRFGNMGKIPLGLAEWFAARNIKSIQKVQDIYSDYLRDATTIEIESGDDDTCSGEMISPPSRIPGLITFTHFLPNQKTLPDWKEPSQDTFLRDEWLDHPGPGTAAKFAKVSGSALIDKQIRSILPPSATKNKNVEPLKHLHIFGHSHCPKDFVYKGIRYIHNPLGKPSEREINIVPGEADFQLVWSCRKMEREKFYSNDNDNDDTISYSGGDGEIPGFRIIRYWEERGGGIKVLTRKIKHRRLRRRIKMKRMLREMKKG